MSKFRADTFKHLPASLKDIRQAQYSTHIGPVRSQRRTYLVALEAPDTERILYDTEVPAEVWILTRIAVTVEKGQGDTPYWPIPPKGSFEIPLDAAKLPRPHRLAIATADAIPPHARIQA